MARWASAPCCSPWCCSPRRASPACSENRVLELRGLRKHFGGVVATDDVSLRLERGEIHALIGPNGAGKTTLIGQIAGTLAPDGGEIFFEGSRITKLAA